ncbi:hypothetical protein [Myxococcus faecalis]|uniref:hypothetical protein n=1 Tax=Myxococcus faecalis TaxID=3115646 RepID=UPI003CE820B6
MKRWVVVPWLLFTFACASTAPGALPLRAEKGPEPEVTLLWVGEAQAERFEEGAWKRVPAFDYEFTVEQRRFGNHWESVKHLRRRHPDYDGSAGPREQTMFFRVDLGAVESSGRVALKLVSTLGPGEGTTDRAFREAKLVFRPELSSFAPFDTYRIQQHYEYEQGLLKETVSLDKGERPWVRNHERAGLFAPHRFESPPTTR